VQAELAQIPPEIRLLVNEDPPTHRRTRSLVSAAFSPKHVTAIAPRVHAIAQELIDQFCAVGQADLVRQYTYPLPMRVLLEFVVPIKLISSSGGAKTTYSLFLISEEQQLK
jgi:cytochrome P450